MIDKTSSCFLILTLGLLIGVGLSPIPSLVMSLISGTLVGLTLVGLMILTKTTRLLPLIQGSLVVLCQYNPLFIYMVLGTILGLRVVIKVSRTLSSQMQVEGIEEGVIANSIEEVNTLWAIHSFWGVGITLASLLTGSLFGMGVIKDFGQLLLICSLVVSPLVWFLYILQLEKEERGKFILGGLLSCTLLGISLILLFKGSILGMLIPFVLLASPQKGINKGIKQTKISTQIWGGGIRSEVLTYVLASGLFRAMFIFFGGSLLVHMINKEYNYLTPSDKFNNHCHSEAIGESLQPLMLWGYLLSRGEMDAFAQLGRHYILSSSELLILVLLIISLQYLFFLLRGDILQWLLSNPPLHLSMNETNSNFFTLDTFLVLLISTIITTLIMGNPMPFLCMFGISLLYNQVFKHFRLPSLSQGMGTTFIPITLYLGT